MRITPRGRRRVADLRHGHHGPTRRAACLPSPSSLFYLTAQAGEADNCRSPACGTIPKPRLWERTRRHYLAPQQADFDFLHREPVPHRGQGGSDVGANAVRAGRYRAVSRPVQVVDLGRKWFCSNADADVFVMTARPEGAPTVHEVSGSSVTAAETGRALNAFRIRRLKDKLGTRSMASGEMDFTDAYAEALGPVDSGFKSVIQLVITTSRLYNAAGCAAHARRASRVPTRSTAAPSRGLSVSSRR